MLALTALPAAQQAGVPSAPQTARDATTRPAVGTAMITGTLVSDDASPRPIRRGLITLSSAEIRASRSTSTDDDGRFAFPGLPAGRYTLSASKPAYASSYYGAPESWRGPGSPITLEDGQRQDVKMRILHGGVLAGTILDSSGRPQSGVRVVPLRFRNVGGERQAQYAAVLGFNLQGTDDLGAFRIYGLPPGEYAIGASLPSINSSEIRQITAAEIQWAQQLLQHPGQATAGGGAAMTSAPPPGPAMGYAPVFYPGTSDPAAAGIISLGPSEERTGIDFALRWVPTARIDGTVVDQEGRPASGVQLNLVAKTSIPLIFPIGGAGRSDNSGKFSFQGVTPGDYTIVAQSVGRAGGPPPVPDPAGRGGAAPPPQRTMWARETLAVTGTDLTGLSLRLQAGLTVSGRVAFEGDTPPPADLSRVRVGLAPGNGPGGMTIIVGSSQAQVNADGTFTISGVTPGQYRVNGSVPGTTPSASGAAPTQTWTLKSALANGVEALDSNFEVGTADLSGVVLTFTDHPTELSGTLLDSAGKPASGYWVIAFSADRTFWTVASRRVRSSRPDAQGKFRFVGLPPGDYNLVALTELDQADLADPSFLDQLAAASYKITLADGEKKTQDLKLSGGRPD